MTSNIDDWDDTRCDDCGRRQWACTCTMELPLFTNEYFLDSHPIVFDATRAEVFDPIETAIVVSEAPAPQRVLGVGGTGCIHHPRLKAAELEDHACEESA